MSASLASAPAQVRERPILFSGEMVRALLDGRKTQTRRVMIPQPPDWITEFGFTAFTPKGHISGRGDWKGVPGEERPGEKFVRLKYGHAGDRLWVRETFGHCGEPGSRVHYLRYKADEPRAVGAYGAQRWRPSIHMRREWSRLTLELTEVRIESLQEITEREALAEGITEDSPGVGADSDRPFSDGYCCLWDSLNAKRGYGWDVNPWVWVLSFRRVA